MRKVGHIIIVVAFVGVAYILLMLFRPATSAMIETTNSSANWSAHPSFAYAQAVLVGWPFWVYLIPVSIGTVTVVGILKGE